MFTKATFHLLARTIRETREEFEARNHIGKAGEYLTASEAHAAQLALESLARNLADRLQELNPRFDRTRFLTACRSA